MPFFFGIHIHVWCFETQVNMIFQKKTVNIFVLSDKLLAIAVEELVALKLTSSN